VCVCILCACVCVCVSVLVCTYLVQDKRNIPDLAQTNTGPRAIATTWAFDVHKRQIQLPAVYLQNPVTYTNTFASSLGEIYILVARTSMNTCIHAHKMNM